MDFRERDIILGDDCYYILHERLPCADQWRDVWLAKQSNQAKPTVRITFLNKESQVEFEFWKRIDRRFEAWMQLTRNQSDNIVRMESVYKPLRIQPEIREGSIDKVRQIIVTENLSGGSLKSLLKRKEAISPLWASHMLFHLARGLWSIHGTGFLHLDIQPEKVLLQRKGEAVESKWASPGRCVRIQRDSPNNAGITCDYHYLAPEVFRGAGVTPAADIYSLGVVLFESLTLRRPFEGTFPQVVYQHAVEPPNWSRLPTDTPTWMQNVLQRMLRKNPKHRYAHACELLDDLRQHVDVQNCPPPSDQIPKVIGEHGGDHMEDPVGFDHKALRPVQRTWLPSRHAILNGTTRLIFPVLLVAGLLLLGFSIVWFGNRAGIHEYQRVLSKEELSNWEKKGLKETICEEFVLIEADTFKMGARYDGARDTNGKSAAESTESFYMMKRTLPFRSDADNAIAAANRYSEIFGLPPCYSVEGSLMVEYPKAYHCESFRLPTETEWELAARAGSTHRRYAHPERMNAREQDEQADRETYAIITLGRIRQQHTYRWFSGERLQKETTDAGLVNMLFGAEWVHRDDINNSSSDLGVRGVDPLFLSERLWLFDGFNEFASRNSWMARFPWYRRPSVRLVVSKKDLSPCSEG